MATCKAADVGTTIIALSSGRFTEANPIVRGLLGPGLHNYFPFIAVSAAVVAVIWWFDDPIANAVGSTVSCGVAAHNAWLLMK